MKQTITTIPLLDLRPEIELLWDELNAAIAEVLRSGQFIMGPAVEQFEREVAGYLGVKHAVGVNSGTDALVIALDALGIGPGDEVITTAFTFVATAEAISHMGGRPVLADIEAATLNIDPARIEEKITARTKAIVPVHLFGHAADMRAIGELAARHSLAVVEDVAQAFGGEHEGRKLGTLGDLGAFSFFPSKNLGAYGDGGLIVTGDDRLAERARMLRTHGSKRKYYNEIIGYNSRLDSIQAAILRVKLPRVDDWNEARRRVADRYREALAGVASVTPPGEAAYARHVFHQYTVRISGGQRDAVQQSLAGQGIQTAAYYSHPIYKLPAYEQALPELVQTEAASGEVLSLPMGPYLSEAEIDRVARAVGQFYS